MSEIDWPGTAALVLAPAAGRGPSRCQDAASAATARDELLGGSGRLLAETCHSGKGSEAHAAKADATGPLAATAQQQLAGGIHSGPLPLSRSPQPPGSAAMATEALSAHRLLGAWWPCRDAATPVSRRDPDTAQQECLAASSFGMLPILRPLSGLSLAARETHHTPMNTWEMPPVDLCRVHLPGALVASANACAAGRCQVPSCCRHAPGCRRALASRCSAASSGCCAAAGPRRGATLRAWWTGPAARCCQGQG